MQEKNITAQVSNVKPTSPGACFYKAPKSFRAREAIFSQAVFKNREVYTPETSYGMEGTSVHLRIYE